jgi:hypothetical protein
MCENENCLSVEPRSCSEVLQTRRRLALLLELLVASRNPATVMALKWEGFHGQTAWEEKLIAKPQYR